MPLNSSDSPPVMIEFRNVEYRVAYDMNGATPPIVTALNFEIKSGETIVLLGESGCGKTTTLRLINRLLLPTSGDVIIQGKPTSEWDSIRLRRLTGYVIQEAGLFPHFTVERNIALIPTLENWDEARTRERAREMLQLVGLDPSRFSQRYPHELSGGQRQRVGVARALAADPPILLLDEPFGALDPITRASLQREFVELCEQLGKTSVFVTHDLREALFVASRIGLMRAGRMILLESPENFMASDDEYARAYRATLEMK